MTALTASNTTPIAPGYFKTNFRALNMRELVRLHGFFRMPIAYVLGRRRRPSPTGWMPMLWADLECARQDLSENFWQTTALHRSGFERLGFIESHLHKMRRLLDPSSRDDGAVIYMNETRCEICEVSQRWRGVSPIKRTSAAGLIQTNKLHSKPGFGDDYSCA